MYKDKVEPNYRLKCLNILPFTSLGSVRLFIFWEINYYVYLARMH